MGLTVRKIFGFSKQKAGKLFGFFNKSRYIVAFVKFVHVCWEYCIQLSLSFIIQNNLKSFFCKIDKIGSNEQSAIIFLQLPYEIIWPSKYFITTLVNLDTGQFYKLKPSLSFEHAVIRILSKTIGTYGRWYWKWKVLINTSVCNSSKCTSIRSKQLIPNLFWCMDARRYIWFVCMAYKEVDDVNSRCLHTLYSLLDNLLIKPLSTLFWQVFERKKTYMGWTNNWKVARYLFLLFFLF